MADLKISQLTGASTPLAGTEVLPIVQSGSTVKVSVANLTAGRAISATQLTLTTGSVIVASGQGIDFSATPGTGTSELLNDYEEGTWTPKDAVGANLTITGTAAYYRKVGSIVTITFDATWTTDTTPTITNLPFTNLGSHAGGCFAFNTTTAVASALILNGNASIDLYNGINSSFNPASKRFIGSFVYQTS